VCAAALTPLWAAGERPPTHAKPVAPASAWDQAQKARAAFEQQPAGMRTKVGYARVLDGFRAIYHANPRDAHAADAINAVAEVLAEQGRELDDAQSLKAAVGQYEFLRTQYPASPLRAQALLAEARIERDDLGDAALAKAKLKQLVKESPRSEAAADARKELAGQSKAKREEGRESATVVAPIVAAPIHHDDAVMNAAQKIPAPLEVEQPVASPAGKKTLAQVTGIRHWSTATYTRVAIDLGDEVKFEAARVPNPDRIYFDLHGAKLAQELVGKSFDVTDDGFLKRIRAAQAGGDVTRVVLDVSDVTEYSAFLLPNPYRLIIDIHGGKAQASAARMQAAPPDLPPAAANSASAAANVSGLPAMSPTDGGEAVRPIPASAAVPDPRPSDARRVAPIVPVVLTVPQVKPVPNTVATAKPGTTSEVAAVSLSPGRVEATSAPTSKPIVATVKAATVKAATVKAATVKAATVKAATIKAATINAKEDDAVPAKAAEKTAAGETSLIRALGLKINRIVIDAGHGGHDSGTLGVDGIQEKDVVLDVALRVGKMLHERLGAEIIYTRSDDTFIPLETRTAMANKAQADLFLSIHANSSPDPSARGVEVYYLNFTSDPTALDVAARENAVAGESIHQLSDLVKKIALKDKIAESREFAADVEGSLFTGLTKGNAGLRDRGVKKAPFVVLIGANMPSILAEISFVTNARDAEQLREPEYRQRVAESLFNGVARYESGLAGAKAPAPAMKRASLQ
jgi:N-acetylmuramoyl-L-alanine amidase